MVGVSLVKLSKIDVQRLSVNLAWERSNLCPLFYTYYFLLCVAMPTADSDKKTLFGCHNYKLTVILAQIWSILSYFLLLARPRAALVSVCFRVDSIRCISLWIVFCAVVFHVAHSISLTFVFGVAVCNSS